MRILLADDDVPTLEIVQTYFEHIGHEAEIAANGLECVAILNHFLPDVLVLDCELLWGGSDGVLEVMRQSARRSTPVILTGSNETFAYQHRPPVVGYLQKPFRLSDLLERVVATATATPWPFAATLRWRRPTYYGSLAVPRVRLDSLRSADRSTNPSRFPGRIRRNPA